MNVSYKRDMTHNYMVPETTENVSEDDYRVHMLMENHIQGLLPCCMRRVNCQSRFFYDITSRQSMEHVYGNSRMRAEDIRQLLRGLYRALREIKKYLLDMDRIILEPGMIYMDIETREPLFCYLPGYQKDIMQSFRELAMYLLERLDETDQQAVLLGYEIYRRAREENYSLEKILQEAGAPEEIRELNDRGNAGWSAGGSRAFTGQGAGGGRVIFPRQSVSPAGNANGTLNSPGPDTGGRQGFLSGRTQHTGDRKGQSVRERQEEKAIAQNNVQDHIDFRQYDFPGEDIGPEEDYGIYEKNEKKMKKKKEKIPKKKEQHKKDLRERDRQEKEDSRAGRLFLVICFLVAAALLAVAAWFWRLTVTQIGGVAFLLVAILIYGCTMDSRNKKRGKKKEDKKLQRAMEDFEEEEWPEESAPASQYRQQPMYVGERTRYGAAAQSADRSGGNGRGAAWYGAQSADRSGGNGRGGARYGAQGVDRSGGSGRGAAWYGAQGADRSGGNGRGAAWYSAQGADRFDGNGRGAAERRLGDTGVLVEGVDNESHLILVSTNPQRRDSIVLEKDSYVVGKLPAQADLVLEHPSVSRVHAKLDRLGNDYYLCDLNSTNGTFVNGRRLMVNESVKLNPSDEIAFARVGFQVVKY